MRVEAHENGSRFNRGLRRQAIVESLLADVFRGQLRPGQHLITQEMAERFGVSHTPIREALISLAGIGVIDLLPNRGAIVRQVTARDVREVCQVRRVLECEATRLACGQIDLADLDTLAGELRQLLERATQIASRSATNGRGCASGNPAETQFIERARVLDSHLHDLVASSCGNKFLAAELARLKTLYRALRDVSWAYDQSRNDYRRLAGECREHLAIVEALLADKPREAARAMSQHIRSGVKYWSRSIPAAAAEPAARSVRKRQGSANGQTNSK